MVLTVDVDGVLFWGSHYGNAVATMVAAELHNGENDDKNHKLAQVVGGLMSVSRMDAGIAMAMTGEQPMVQVVMQ